MRCCHRAKRFNHSIANAGLLGLLLSVSGCAVGPDFDTPEAMSSKQLDRKARLTRRNEVRYKEFYGGRFLAIQRSTT